MLVDIATPERMIYADICRFAGNTYAQRLGVSIVPDPDAFAYALEGSEVVACIGLYRACNGREVMLERYVPDAFDRISGTSEVDRCSCAEVGTRAVSRIVAPRHKHLSLALSACLLIYAHMIGLRYLAFTSNRTAILLARALDVELIYLDRPDPSRMTESFLKKWQAFFDVQPLCFGFKLESVSGCRNVLEKLRGKGITTIVPSPGST